MAINAARMISNIFCSWNTKMARMAKSTEAVIEARETYRVTMKTSANQARTIKKISSEYKAMITPTSDATPLPPLKPVKTGKT